MGEDGACTYLLAYLMGGGAVWGRRRGAWEETGREGGRGRRKWGGISWLRSLLPAENKILLT